MADRGDGSKIRVGDVVSVADPGGAIGRPDAHREVVERAKIDTNGRSLDAPIEPIREPIRHARGDLGQVNPPPPKAATGGSRENEGAKGKFGSPGDFQTAVMEANRVLVVRARKERA